jgi:hypothetical protein
MRQLGLSAARTSAGKPSIQHDRRIPEEFRAELSPGGRFERLVRFARGRHLADVQLRAVGSVSWATIYCGPTNVLHLEHRRTRPISAPRRQPAYDRQPGWTARGGSWVDHLVHGGRADGRVAGHRDLHDGAVHGRPHAPHQRRPHSERWGAVALRQFAQLAGFYLGRASLPAGTGVAVEDRARLLVSRTDGANRGGQPGAGVAGRTG